MVDGGADCGTGCVTVGILGGVSVATGGVGNGNGSPGSPSLPMFGDATGGRSHGGSISIPASVEDEEEVVVVVEEEEEEEE